MGAIKKTLAKQIRDRLNWQRAGRQELQTEHPMGLAEDRAAAEGGADKAALH